MKNILFVMLWAISFGCLAQNKIDDYQEFKIKSEIHNGLLIEVDTVYSVVDTVAISEEAIPETKTKIHVDYKLVNHTDQVLLKTEFRLLFVNELDGLEHDIDIAYYNTIEPGEEAMLRKVSSVKPHLVVDMNEVIDTVVVLEEVYVQIDKDGQQVNRRIDFK